MLVFISDLHLTDETTAFNVDPDAFALLQGEIEQMAKRRDARELHLVLLGDIFDFVRTDYWLDKVKPEDRPWNGDLDPATAMNPDPRVEQDFGEVLKAILATPAAKKLIEVMKALPSLKVTYVLGNHDRVFCNYPSLQAHLRQHVPQVTFAHSIEEPRYGVVGRHGHEWEENTHGWVFHKRVLRQQPRLGQFDPDVYKIMAIGEVVTAELMSGLIHYIKKNGPTGDADFDALVARFKDVNNLRPMLDVFQWFEWFGGTVFQKHYSLLYDALRVALDGVLNAALAKKWDRIQRDFLVSGDLVDRLQLLRAHALGKDFRSFQKKVRTATPVINLIDTVSKDRDHLREGAEQEIAGKSPDVQFIVYGHTHQARHDYFSGTVDGKVRMYINTGTYLPLITKARDGRSFASTKQMTITFFYRDDEDTHDKAGGPSVDVWAGIRRKDYA